MTSGAPKSSPFFAIRRVWRQEGWPGVAGRLRARLWWLGPPPRAVRPPPLRKPDLLEIAGRSRESFAAEISLPAAGQPLVSVLVPALDHVEYTLCCLAAMCRHPPAGLLRGGRGRRRLHRRDPPAAAPRAEPGLSAKRGHAGVRALLQPGGARGPRALPAASQQRHPGAGGVARRAGGRLRRSHGGHRRLEAHLSERPSAGGGGGAALRRQRRAGGTERRPAGSASTTWAARSIIARGPA